MSETGQSTANADTLAVNLFNTLLAGADFTPPAIDFNSPEFQIPTATTDNPLYVEVPNLGEAALTTRKVDGSGMFDGLMAALDEHLSTQYVKGRLTGEAYSRAYIELSQAAMGNAVNYLLQDRTSYFQAIVAQKQAQIAEIGVVTERVRLAISKAELAMKLTELNTRKAEYALSKMKLSTEDAQYALTLSQRETVHFNNEFMLPAQLVQLNKQIDIANMEISYKTAQKDQLLYQTASILPAQKAGIDAENAIKVFTLENQLPAQVASITADTVGKDFNNDFILPEQYEALKEQTESNRAKTLDTRRDGVTLVKGAIGVQKDLQKQQIQSYKHDAEAKVAKMLLDTWMTQKSMDEGLDPPASITDVNINRVMTLIRSNLALT